MIGRRIQRNSASTIAERRGFPVSWSTYDEPSVCARLGLGRLNEFGGDEPLGEVDAGKIDRD
jgi:hypothetical protein